MSVVVNTVIAWLTIQFLGATFSFYLGHSVSNQRKKMTTLSDVDEIWCEGNVIMMT